MNKELEFKIKELAESNAINYEGFKVMEGVDCNQLYHFAIDFAHYMCEEQKKVCSESAKIAMLNEWQHTVNKDSILNSPNVCS